MSNAAVTQYLQTQYSGTFRDQVAAENILINLQVNPLPPLISTATTMPSSSTPKLFTLRKEQPYCVILSSRSVVVRRTGHPLTSLTNKLPRFALRSVMVRLCWDLAVVLTQPLPGL